MQELAELIKTETNRHQETLAWLNTGYKIMEKFKVDFPEEDISIWITTANLWVGAYNSVSEDRVIEICSWFKTRHGLVFKRVFNPSATAYLSQKNIDENKSVDIYHYAKPSCVLKEVVEPSSFKYYTCSEEGIE